MKRVCLVTMVILLISLAYYCQAEKVEPGQIVYHAQKNNSNYRIFLHALQPASDVFTIKAIKVTYEPSGTVVLMIFDTECPEVYKTNFKAGKSPLSVVETKISEIAPSVVIPFPEQIEKDNLIKIEYLVDEGKVNKTMLISAASVQSIEKVDFSSVILKGGGGGFRHCCTCGACQPCCVTCNTPYYTCCCGDGIISCGIIKCPSE